eukprot:c25721_g1_i2 orf=130-1485(+)
MFPANSTSLSSSFLSSVAAFPLSRSGFRTAYFVPSDAKLRRRYGDGLVMINEVNAQLGCSFRNPVVGGKVWSMNRNLDVDDVETVLLEFNAQLPIEEALTPPSAWYTHPEIFGYELERVFSRGWQVVGHAAQVERPHDYFTGSLGRARYVVCRDDRGDLYAFHNVCRHHAAPVASGSGCNPCFVCPYHGWTYSLNGKLQKTTRLGGIRRFSAAENSLLPVKVATWGPFVLISLDEDKTAVDNNEEVGDEWLGNASDLLASACIDASLCHVARREYVINCNWKVFCDNYLDGGYHVPFAHGGLASNLNLQSYSTELFEKVSVQSCETKEMDDNGRLGEAAVYAFVYPNFMINRYGPWMDTNLVLPTATNECQVIFDYFLDVSFKNDNMFIEQSLQDSEVVQVEDISLCEGVQMGLESPAFNRGRYAPRVEMAMHHFHSLLQRDLSQKYNYNS